METIFAISLPRKCTSCTSVLREPGCLACTMALGSNDGSTVSSFRPNALLAKVVHSSGVALANRNSLYRTPLAMLMAMRRSGHGNLGADQIEGTHAWRHGQGTSHAAVKLREGIMAAWLCKSAGMAAGIGSCSCDFSFGKACAARSCMLPFLEHSHAGVLANGPVLDTNGCMRLAKTWPGETGHDSQQFHCQRPALA